ncbi:MAG: Fic family protein [Chitinispirillaceae bacterium]|nr:Fic family protein [Chitinispirillaceae bacterium]
MKRTTGEYVTSSTAGETVRAFVPHPLPPSPALEITPALQERLDKALIALGRLDSATSLLPDTALFLYMYVRKEAVLSSQIEGTQSSLSDLLLFEIEEMPGVPLDEVREVSRYVAALYYGLKRLKEGFPLCSRLLREIHGVLLAAGRGAEKGRGEFRRSQNWIGGSRPGNARYVPPPADKVTACMADLENYLHNTDLHTPLLVKAALAHVQFETIHPFLDGNGRLGRLLITLVLGDEKILREPLLYLSLYFKSHRDEYYALLQRVRTEGDWEAWVAFFAEAVETTARQAAETAAALLKRAREDRDRIGQLKRIGGTVLRVHQALQEKPLLTISIACRMTKLHPATVAGALKKLQELGMVREVTGKRRNRTWSYDRYITLLSEGTEPIKSRPDNL